MRDKVVAVAAVVVTYVSVSAAAAAAAAADSTVSVRSYARSSILVIFKSIFGQVNHVVCCALKMLAAEEAD